MQESHIEAPSPVVASKRSRARKTSELPTLVYKYGVTSLSEDGEVTVDRLLWLAHEYQCELVAVENKRRHAADRLLCDADATFAQLHLEFAALDPEKTAKRDYVSKGRMLSRRRRELMEDGKLATAIKGLGAEAHLNIKRQRAIFSSRGLPWGTYLKIEDSVRQAAGKGGELLQPRFHGAGNLYVQVQKSKELGTTGLAGDTRLQIDPLPAGVLKMTRGERRRATRTNARIRIGSNDDRSPVWLGFSVIIHRPLPDDANIKWAWLGRSPWFGRSTFRSGYNHETGETTEPVHRQRYQYFLCLAFEAIPRLRAAGERRCASITVDAAKTDGRMVMGVLEDGEESREVCLPDNVVSRLRKVRELHSIRDRLRNELVGELSTPVVVGRLPAHLVDVLTRFPDIRRREFPDAYRKWEADGGSGMEFDRLGEYCRKDRHLYAWQCEQQSRTLGCRNERYRLMAIELCERYSELTIAAPRSLRIQYGPHDKNYAKKLIAAGIFIDAIQNAAKKYGTKITRVVVAENKDKEKNEPLAAQAATS